jgi:hypothetical protein
MADILWKKESLPESQCVLCMDTINLDETIVIRLPCGHVFDYNCFVNLKRSQCPNCRSNIDIPMRVTTPSFENRVEHRESIPIRYLPRRRYLTRNWTDEYFYNHFII